MNFSITYRAEYRYSSPVTDQHNAIRIRPIQSDRQRVDHYDLSISPPTRVYEHTDYYGSHVTQFSIGAAHEHLDIRAESRVTTIEQAFPTSGGWEALGSREYREMGAEYLGPLSPSANPAKIAPIAAEVRAENPLETLIAIAALIPDRFEYRPGATYVGSTVNDLLEGGAGVCQDFVHLALTVLRSLGVASRYVSGYLWAPGGEGQQSAEVNTHAWLEALIPDADGTPQWIPADPTNRVLASTSHVKIGHGRAYSDVPPIRGVYRGTGRATIDVGVTMTQLQPTVSPTG